MVDNRNTRSRFQRESDRRTVTKLYLQGKTQSEIGEIVGVSRSQVGYDLAVVRKQWLKQTSIALEEHTAQQLAELGMVAGEAWAAWERSLSPREITIVEQVDDGTRKAVIRKEERDGSSSYLEIILRCIERRCRILGLDASLKAEVSVGGGLASLSKLMYERQALEAAERGEAAPPLGNGGNGSTPSLAVGRRRP